MRVLWITNSPVYDTKSELPNIVREGWIQGALNGILHETEIEFELVNLFPIGEKEKALHFFDREIEYISFPADLTNRKYLVECEQSLKDTLATVRADVIHIWGTERVYCEAAIKAAIASGYIDRTVISLHGINISLSRTLLNDIPSIYRMGFSVPEIAKRTSLNKLVKLFESRALYEEYALKNVKYLIGRTKWDKDVSLAINTNAHYFKCNETLRPDFYRVEKVWNIEECKKYSVFICQGLTVGKGMQQLLKAFPEVVRRFPKAHIYCTGEIGKNNKYGIKALSSFEKYIEKLINNNGLRSHISFLGQLDSEKMIAQYLSSHLFVCPSYMENESNALSEAKILGLPCVVADSGGMGERVDNGVDGFKYQAGDWKRLSKIIISVFEDDKKATDISHNARKSAQYVNCMRENANQLLEIYTRIIDKE